MTPTFRYIFRYFFRYGAPEAARVAPSVREGPLGGRRRAENFNPFLINIKVIEFFVVLKKMSYFAPC
jgi:hypothetical protein